MSYDDLLGVPFRFGGDDPMTGLDCWGLAKEVCRRAGITSFPDVTRTTPEESDLSAVVTTLEEVDQATRIGDLLFSDPEDHGYPSHVSVLVAPGWALTTTTKHGPRALPLHRVDNECGVWRCR